MNKSCNNLTFEDFSKKFKEELNTWQEIENQNGEFGIDEFIVSKGTKLGDYIEFFTNEIDMISKIVLENEKVIGFVCYVLNKNNSVHIEMVGVNPNFRKLGYAKKILLKLKEEVIKNYSVKKVTLAVNKRNKAGINSFSKFAKETAYCSSDDYIGFEL